MKSPIPITSGRPSGQSGYTSSPSSISTDDAGATNISFALPNKKIGKERIYAISWIDKRSDLAQAMQRAIISALTAFVAAEGGAL